jgi:endonuclease/exonuclease/phosphatase family metal-dependent hydrolase
LDATLNQLCNIRTEFVICGDINVNYLDNCHNRQQLDNVLSTYNLNVTVYFPTRITNDSATAIDNIFVDKTRKYTISPFINGLSDHDAQLLPLKNITLQRRIPTPQYIRNINKCTISEFQLK